MDMSKRQKNLDSNAHTDSEDFMDEYTIKNRGLSFGIGQTIGKKLLNFSSVHDNLSEVTVCTKMERFSIAHNERMVGENEGTC